MATSGTHTFTLDLSDIMEEAYDLCGLELRSGYSYWESAIALFGFTLIASLSVERLYCIAPHRYQS